MVIIFPPFHFPLLPSSPSPLHLLLQAINLSYKCHSVHVCCMSAHSSMCTFVHMQACMSCVLVGCTQEESVLTCLKFSLSHLFWTLSIWHVLLNQTLTKKKMKTLCTNILLVFSLHGTHPHIITSYCIPSFEPMNAHPPGTYGHTVHTPEVV